MKLKCTKTLANELNKNIKDYEISLIKLSENEFTWYVDIDKYKHEIDFDYKTNKYNVLCVYYPNNYYACNKYITTNELSEIFNKCDKTLNGFIKAFFEYVEI